MKKEKKEWQPILGEHERPVHLWKAIMAEEYQKLIIKRPPEEKRREKTI